MKKIYLIIIVFFALNTGLMADHHQINISGFSYSPDYLTVNVGDTVTISASATHPLVQVSSTTWYEEEETPLSGGFGPTTSDYTFEITSQDTIFYVCENHVGSGMKGKIAVSSTTGVPPEPTFDFTIYPNPAPRGYVTVSVPHTEGQNKVLQLYNAVGQLMHAENFSSGKISINTGLPAGAYFIIVRSEEFMRSRKLQISR
ncbi:MAG TPA: T9SS type A sorting domain-containing protein [Salinivirga sp.]|uniref:T9SS type A sorting domain-containing protein n=1 Tax=Salinivirga sp. TaxID=1970192 RepID=UPI002B48FA04|nr:T9SS type A sorting domain-containing protein [Salinivirga sp.]HKK60539.1 T9SS type A sorting domain-containing protein [Salinivirga sp.]